MLEQKTRYLMNLISLTMLVGFALLDINYLLIIALAILAFLILDGDAMEDFYVYLSLTPFYLFLTNSSSVSRYFFFAMVIFSVLKLILRERRKKYACSLLFSSVLLLSVQIFNDILIAKTKESLSVVIYLAYFVIYIMKADLAKYNNYLALRNIVTGSIAALIIFVVSNPINQLAYTTNMIRLGDNARILGGAMAAPIYSLLVISLLISHMILNKIDIWQRIFSIGCISFAFTVGFFSVSRSYLLGLFIMILMLLLSTFSEKSVKTFLLLITGAILSGSFYLVKPEYIENILFKYSYRIGTTGNIRIEIYKSVLQYLKDNPIAIFLGVGAKNYIKIGNDGNYLFRMMAHNLYLDALISWGIIGVFCLTIIVVHFIKKCKRFSKGQISIISVMPATILAVLYITEGTFNYFNIYIYIIFLILNSAYIEKVNFNLKGCNYESRNN